MTPGFRYSASLWSRAASMASAVAVASWRASKSWVLLSSLSNLSGEFTMGVRSPSPRRLLDLVRVVLLVPVFVFSMLVLVIP